jgi:uncharacterized BrkB/YihY/UPF0761 family membrane protein
LLSSAPLLVILLSIAGMAFREDVVREQLKRQFTELMGPDGERAVRMMIEHADKPGAGLRGGGLAGGLSGLVYYSALILFYGAEFTKVYANEWGSHIEPTDNAVAVTDRNCVPQATPAAQPAEPARHS